MFYYRSRNDKEVDFVLKDGYEIRIVPIAEFLTCIYLGKKLDWTCGPTRPVVYADTAGRMSRYAQSCF